MKEIISIHIGQFGIQLGETCWDLFCLEQGIQPDGFMPVKSEKDTFLTPLFSETSKGKFIPRSLFIDSDPSTINEIRKGAYRQLFDIETSTISGMEDADTFSRGFNSLGKDLLSKTNEKMRKLLESCDNLHGFMIYNSTVGGTGSGFNSLLLPKLRDITHKKTFVNFTNIPSPKLSTSTIESYNTILSLKSLLDNSNMSILFDNESIYKICSKFLNLKKPNYNSLNQIIAQVASSLIAGYRFEGPMNFYLRDLVNSLVPFSNMKFMMASHSPLTSLENRDLADINTSELVVNSFSHESQLISCDPRNGKFANAALIFRGNNAYSEIASSLKKINELRTIQFTDFSSSKFKICHNYQNPITVPGSDFSKSSRTVSSITNSTAISEAFSRITHKFDMLFSKKAFFHWFEKEGTSVEEFKNARKDWSDLEKEYEEFGNNIKEDETEIKSESGKKISVE